MTVITTEELKANKVNRTSEEDYQENGKGINVSIMLKKLGVDTTALGFTAGFTGTFINDQLIKRGITTDFVEIDGITRVNIFVRSTNREYKIVNQGPEVDEQSVEVMLEKLKALPERSTLIVSGSVPKGVDESIYVEIAKLAEQRNINLILDISSKKILDCLSYHPYLIKPNKEELEHFYDTENLCDGELIELGEQLLTKGAERVLISMGEKGAIYMDQHHRLKVSSVQGEVVNTACAGDTMLAMFVHKIQAGSSLEQALIYASAAGSSTAFTKGLSDLTDIEIFVKEITITDLKGGNGNE